MAVLELSQVFIWSPTGIAQPNVQCQVPGLLQVKELKIIKKIPELFLMHVYLQANETY